MKTIRINYYRLLGLALIFASDIAAVALIVLVWKSLERIALTWR